MNNTTGSAAYKKAGVDLDAADSFGAFTGKICEYSWGNSPFVRVEDWSNGHFRGPRLTHYVGHVKGLGQLTAPDGIGTKTIIISAAGCVETAPSNLLEMVAFDIARWGGLPLILVNHLEPKNLGEKGSILREQYERMMLSLATMANDQGYVLINGETAQMGVCVSSEWNDEETVATKPIFNWSAVMLGVASPEKRIDGSTLAPGQRIIALRDSLRSNGASLCRKYLAEVFGARWWENPEAKETIAAMAAPSALYSRFMAVMNGWYDWELQTEIKVHAIAHLSGGGIKAKFCEGVLFPRGFCAKLDKLWDPPKFMTDCVRQQKISDEEGYNVFNGGQGALVVIDGADVPRFRKRALDFGIDAGDAGEIVKGDSNGCWVEVDSKFGGPPFRINKKR